MSLKLYMTSVTSSRETKSQQNDIMRILDTHGVQYEQVDISVDKCILGEMREKAGNPSAIPPQLFSGDNYIGGFKKIMDAVEDGNLDQILQVQK
ncbi:SH3 domain-binding glutamic acid-rich-like protein 3 isoform X2 [Dendrobates tinctorius]|uniref:SH3 domain-binding glutamic acid-rich-like protein 3 isoform X2 n=1 Tax=Dendrobates tinctorius TaxID=92724 RepID=UPI003CC995CA